MTGNPRPGSWPHAIKNALLDREDGNVIIVGWERGAAAGWTLKYAQPAANTRLVGAMVCRSIRRLGNTFKIAVFQFTQIVLKTDNICLPLTPVLYLYYRHPRDHDVSVIQSALFIQTPSGP